MPDFQSSGWLSGRAFFGGRGFLGGSDENPAFINAARALSPSVPAYKYPIFHQEKDSLELSRKSRS